MKKMFLFLNKKILMFVMLLLSGYVWVNADAEVLYNNSETGFDITSVSSPYQSGLGINYSPGQAFNLSFNVNYSDCNNNIVRMKAYAANRTDDGWDGDLKWWKNGGNATLLLNERKEDACKYNWKGQKKCAHDYPVQNYTLNKLYYASTVPGDHSVFFLVNQDANSGNKIILARQTYCVVGAGLCAGEPPIIPDLCPNLGGVQATIPAGLVLTNGQCVYPIDVCPNILEPQSSVPYGYYLSNGQCIEDVCPNILEPQSSVPYGYYLSNGQCIEDVCQNISGLQASAPSGTIQGVGYYNKTCRCINGTQNPNSGCNLSCAANPFVQNTDYLIKNKGTNKSIYDIPAPDKLPRFGANFPVTNPTPLIGDINSEETNSYKFSGLPYGGNTFKIAAHFTRSFSNSLKVFRQYKPKEYLFKGDQGPNYSIKYGLNSDVTSGRFCAIQTDNDHYFIASINSYGDIGGLLTDSYYIVSNGIAGLNNQKWKFITISDKCPNIEKVQLEIPDGLELKDGNCVDNSPTTYQCDNRYMVGTKNSKEDSRKLDDRCNLNAYCTGSFNDKEVQFTVDPYQNLATTTYQTQGYNDITQNPGTSYTYTIRNTKSPQTMDVTVTDSFDGKSKTVTCEADTSETITKPKDPVATPSIKITKKPLVTLDKGGDCELSWKIENMPEGTECTLSGNGIPSSSSDVTKTLNSSYIANDIQSNTKFSITCAGRNLNPSLTESAICRVNPEFNEI